MGCSGGTINYQMAFDTFLLVFNNDSGGVVAVADLPLNVWTHLAATFDGTIFRFYVNGVQVAADMGTLGPVNAAPLEIGGSGGCSTFGGLIDEVSIYDRALSASEVQGIFNAGGAGKCKDIDVDGLGDADDNCPTTPTSVRG
jgi:Concanavalin A-like lectin/glucanases superfamily